MVPQKYTNCGGHSHPTVAGHGNRSRPTNASVTTEGKVNPQPAVAAMDISKSKMAG